jgi:hypothetical protein
MKISRFIITCSFLAASSVSFADTESQKEASVLLDSIGMEKALSGAIEQMLNIQLKQNPTLAPYKGVMLNFFSKYMSYQSMKPELVDMYGNAFSAGELREITAFYQTPVGRKSMQLMPELMAKGSQIGAQRIQANMGEFKNMMAAEAEKIQKLQAK